MRPTSLLLILSGDITAGASSSLRKSEVHR
jgi:hypothetical protein